MIRKWKLSREVDYWKCNRCNTKQDSEEEAKNCCIDKPLPIFSGFACGECGKVHLNKMNSDKCCRKYCYSCSKEITGKYVTTPVGSFKHIGCELKDQKVKLTQKQADIKRYKDVVCQREDELALIRNTLSDLAKNHSEEILTEEL